MSGVYCPRDRMLLYCADGSTQRLRCKDGHLWEWEYASGSLWKMKEIGRTNQIKEHSQQATLDQAGHLQGRGQ